MQKILVKYEENWSDEIDFSEFKIMEESEWEKLKKNIKKNFEETGYHNVYFGTNEDVGYDSYESFIDQFTTIEIDEKEADTISKLLGKESCHFPCLDEIGYSEDDDDDE